MYEYKNRIKAIKTRVIIVKDFSIFITFVGDMAVCLQE